jgi:hypothetical protein
MEPWEVAVTFVGTPFHHRGRSRRRLDCAGLLIVTALEWGFKPKDLKVYGRSPYKDGLYNFLVANCGPPVDRPPQANDVLLLQWPHETEPSHLALVTPYFGGGLGMVHTYAALKKVVQHRLDESWERRIVEVFQWPAKS